MKGSMLASEIDREYRIRQSYKEKLEQRYDINKNKRCNDNVFMKEKTK